LRAVGITRRYGATVANDAVSLDLHAGEIHAVLGENGAGKSTIMKILYGMELPDAGHIELDGKILVLNTPRDAIRAGIGMVHQHFTLVPTLTVAENLLLGTRLAGWVQLRRRPALARLAALARQYRIEVDLAARVDTLSVGAQQRVEILKALIGGARALILDEPTAVLAPQEAAALFTTLRELAAGGWGIFIVTHKLADVMQFADRVTVMRQARRVGTWPAAAISAEALVSHMIARAATDAAPTRTEAVPGQAVLTLREVGCAGSHGRPGLRGLTLTVHAGEIVGIAGIEGNGQRELAEIITGLRRVLAGSARYGGAPIGRQATAALLRDGIAHVPQDRHRDGVVLDFSVAENAALVAHAEPPLRRRGLLDHGRARGFAEQLIRDYDIRCAGPRALLRSLSGGNQQKLVLGRELARAPRLLIAAQPTRGLDVGAVDYVHRRLIERRAAGMAVLLISAELDEILALSDRIAVLREGRIVDVLDRAEANAEVVGRLMLAPTAAAA
jgi:simple sugar transport system ATP-binding protein